MKLIILLSLLCISNLQKKGFTKGFDTYCNGRFHYCIDYPDFLVPKPESQNGDGRIFVNKGDTKILTVYGAINQDADGNPISLKKRYAMDIQELISSKNKITYQKLGKGFYVISGEKSNKIFYRKLIMKKTIYSYAILEYSKLGKDVYDPVTVEIFKSFK